MLDFLYRLRIAHSPDVVSSFVSPWRPVGRLVLSILPSHCLLVSFLFVSCGVSFLISFYRLVSSCLLVAFFSFAFPCECSVLFRAVVHPSRRAVLPGHLACPSRFFFIRLIALRICDEAFLRGVLSVSSRWACGSFPTARSLLAYSPRSRDAVSVPGLRYPVMRR